MSTSEDALKLMLSTRRAHENAIAAKIKAERVATESPNPNLEPVLEAGRLAVLAEYAADRARQEYNDALRKENGR